MDREGKEKGTCRSHLKKKNKNSQRKLADGKSVGSTERATIFLFFFLLFISFSDLRKSDLRNSSGKERKVLYVTRATRGYQKHEISPRI